MQDTGWTRAREMESEVKRHRMNRREFAAAAAGLALTVNGIARAQAYPTRPVVWINPSAAGGPTDGLGRAISDPLSKLIGQPIITENVPGAGGTIGTTKAARAAADGYTFLVGHVGYIAAAVSLYKQLPYDPVKDLDAVFRMPSMPGVLVVNPQAPYKTLQELIDYARKNPGKINFGDGGVGTMSNLVAAMLASRAGVEWTPVSHKGNAPALLAVMGGHVDAMIEPPNTAMPQVRAGRLRAIAVTSTEPLAYLPDAPTVASLYPGFEGTIWFGLYAPKGTPKPVIERMHGAYLKVTEDPTFTRHMTEQGMQLLTPAEYAPEALQRFTESEVRKYAEVIREAKIPPQ
jgi:tripartite-type tricarboxylate transporter receptor subunit TctC